jgi:hypothetical protein
MNLGNSILKNKQKLQIVTMTSNLLNSKLNEWKKIDYMLLKLKQKKMH